MSGPAGRSRGDLGWLLAGLALLVLWEASGADLWLAQRFGGPAGFPWRDAWLTSTVLHEGGRALAWVVMALLAWNAWRPAAGGPSPARRRLWLATMLASMALVPALKRLSRTSCPWDLAPFGGAFPYVPHWLPGVADGGPGHCFPSGHAVAAFGFFGLYFLWRAHRPQRARAALAAVWGLGLVFGWAQMARGAHFASHTLWSAWCCWALCSAVAWGLERHPAGADRPTGPAHGSPGVGMARRP